MGLDTSHDCWHGAYSDFMRWRIKIAEVAGLPPLMLMEGFYNSLDAVRNHGLPTLFYGAEIEKCDYLKDVDKLLPIKWECLKPDPLHILLNHSDWDGEIKWQDCAAIANRLEEILPLLPNGDEPGHIGNWHKTTRQFIKGLRMAYDTKENVDFH